MIRFACIALPLLALAAQAQAAPDLNGGTWMPVKPPAALRTVDGKLPPMLPASRKVYEQHVTQRRSGDLSFDGMERCLPPGLPRLLTQPQPFEFLQRPEQIVVWKALQP